MILKFPWTQFSLLIISQGSAVLFPLGGTHDAFPFSFFTYFYPFTLSYVNVLIFVISPLLPCFVRLLSDCLPLKLLFDSHVFWWGPLRVIRVACVRMDEAVVCWSVGDLLVATPRKKVTPSSLPSLPSLPMDPQGRVGPHQLLPHPWRDVDRHNLVQALCRWQWLHEFRSAHQVQTVSLCSKKETMPWLLPFFHPFLL